MIRFLLAAVAVAICCSTQLFAADAWFAAGDDKSNITMPNTGDGQFVEGQFDGKKARAVNPASSPPSQYLYFRVPDEVAAKSPATLYVTLHYLDSGFGPLRFQYDNGKNPYAEGPTELVLDSRLWCATTFALPDAHLSRRQNYGADFRILFGAGPVPISRLEVSWTKPEKTEPATPMAERLDKIFKGTIRPKGMEYTFGNEADDTTALLFKYLGVTSVESYVTWQTVEPNAKGEWDWSQWDRQVDVLKRAGLKWVPFLILGPAYSTPNWFRESKDHVPCVCLEHGTASKIESLWNPHLPTYIDRFIGEFAKRYRDSGVIESVLLGIQGDFGEAIYSATGGGWTFIIPGEYHNHLGFWCGDEYAIKSFRDWARVRYVSLGRLNSAWGTDFKSFEEADFPARGEKQIAELRSGLLAANGRTRRRWLDFVEWYRGEMTRWADWWLGTTRKHFPKTRIYLCTGGDGTPELGANFAAQCRVAAKHNAGVRITNEGSDFGGNFAITRWVAAAGRHYDAYFSFEPASAVNEMGIVARIFNAATAGASGIHDYSPNVIISRARIEAQRANLKYLKHGRPIVPIALWYPNTHMTLEWGGFFPKAAELRDVTDLDYVDEDMLLDGALDRYKILVIAHGNIIETVHMQRISDWVARGGTLISLDLPFETVGGDKETFKQGMFRTPMEWVKLGKGSTMLIPGDWSKKDILFEAIRKALKRAQVPDVDGVVDGVYASVMEGGTIMYLNTTDKPVTKSYTVPNWGTQKLTVPARGIAAVDVKLEIGDV